MDSLSRLARAAEDFCAAIEAPDALGRGAFSRRVRNAVAGAYLAAAQLPRAAFSDDALEQPERSTGRHDLLESRVRLLLGADDAFVDVWDPTQPEDPIARSLSQELLEIYEDLKEALALLGHPGEQSAALLWELEWAFQNHWGKHAVDVLRPLHQLAVRYAQER